MRRILSALALAGAFLLLPAGAFAQATLINTFTAWSSGPYDATPVPNGATDVSLALTSVGTSSFWTGSLQSSLDGKAWTNCGTPVFVSASGSAIAVCAVGSAIYVRASITAYGPGQMSGNLYNGIYTGPSGGGCSQGSCIVNNPSASQVIAYSVNGTNSLMLSNPNGGASAGTEYMLSNGTDMFGWGLTGTGASSPGAGLFALSRSGASMEFAANNGAISLAPYESGGVYLPALTLSPSLQAEFFGNVKIDGTCTGCGGSSSSGISGGVSGFIGLFGSATTITGPSPLDYNVTLAGYVSSSKPIQVAASAGVAGLFAAGEGTAPSGVASSDLLWGDSTLHRLRMNNNNAGALALVGITTAAASGDCPQFASNGIDLVDSGTTTCGGGSGNPYTVVTGTTSIAASEMLLTYTGGTGYINVLGANTTTAGNLILEGQSSNGSLSDQFINCSYGGNCTSGNPWYMTSFHAIGVSGGVNGYFDMQENGTLAGIPGTGIIRVTTPNSVTTPYEMEFPGAPPTSGNTYLSCTATNPAVCSWAAGGSGGSGTVTSFSANALSPLFTVSVATATTTPALSFSLSNAAQNSVFAGPASGGTGAPSYQTAPTISAANMTNFPTFNQNTTGNAATATALAATPTQCSSGQAANGIAANGNAQGCFTPSGSGTVNSGTAYGLAYYPASSAAVSSATPFTGLGYFSASAAPAAASSANVQTAIGSGVYDASGAAATAQSNAEAYAANSSNQSSGTLNAARLPAGTQIAIATGTTALATSSIASGACQAVTAGSVNSSVATGAATTNKIVWSPAVSLQTVAGYEVSTSGGLSIDDYITAGYVNFNVCNWTASAQTPGAVTLNWSVLP